MDRSLSSAPHRDLHSSIKSAASLSSARSELVSGMPPAKLVGRPMPSGVKLPEAPTKRVGFAVVGLGAFATQQIIPNLAQTEHCRLAALVSGNRDKAERIAHTHGLGFSHIYDYSEMSRLAEDSDVDVVYIITPNAFHRELAERAFTARKHVLCEKPMATSVADAQAMITAAERAERRLMVAYRAQYDPYNLKAIELIRSGKIGSPKIITSMHGRMLDLDDARDQWRAQRALAGGGSLYDIGIYAINGARYLSGEEPESVTAQLHPGSGKQGVDVEEHISFELTFPSGLVAVCDSSYMINQSKRFHVQGEDGELTLDPATDYDIRHLEWVHGEDGARHSEQLEIPQANQFAAMLDEMAMCVREDRAPKTPGEEGARDLRIMEAIYLSAEEGGKRISLSSDR